MTPSESHPILSLLLRTEDLIGGAPVRPIAQAGLSPRCYPDLSNAAPLKTVTLPLYREAPSNFGVKLPRPGSGPAAELPRSSPA